MSASRGTYNVQGTTFVRRHIADTDPNLENKLTSGTFTQQGNTCGFSLNAYGSTFSQPGGAGSVLASSTSNACPTNPATDHPLFIHLGLLTGDATLYTQPFTVDPYNSLNINVRFGTITFGGRIFSVKQLSW